MSNQIKVTVYSTRGQRKTDINTEATTWGELRPLVEEAGYDLNVLVGTDSINNHVYGLDTVNATELPTQDFILFLRPTKTKSGGRDVSNQSWGQLRNIMMDDISEDESARAYYNSHESGKNYTQLTTNELRDMVENYPEFQAAANAEEEEKEDHDYSEAPDECIENIEECVRTDAQRLSMAKKLVQEVIYENEDDYDVVERAEETISMIEGLQFEVGVSDVEVTTTIDPEIAELERKARELFGDN